MPFEMLGQVHVDQARLDDGVAIAEIDLEDLFHPREHDHHAAAHRQTAARTGWCQPRAAQKGHRTRCTF